MNITLADVLKIDDLIEHARFHSEELGDDWYAFFQLHMGSDKEEHLHHEHQDQHENLPFHDYVTSTVLPVVILQEKQDILVKNVQLKKEKAESIYVEHYSFLANSDIFQPPKQA